jgi:hypothetical protein
MPIMGLIFLRHATNRFYEAKAAIEADKAAGRMPDRHEWKLGLTEEQADQVRAQVLAAAIAAAKRGDREASTDPR